MDLPTCPSCGQSVLDDDVDDCPFCGASMSGKPSKPAAAPAAKAAPSKSTSTASAEKPARTKSRPQQKAATAAVSDGDDPFELERSATKAKKKVVPLHSKPQPGRRHEVVCPMCETVGYTARKAAGMDVRCANPKCEFPLFTAPALDEDEAGVSAAAEASGESKKREFWTPTNIVTIILLVIGTGIAFYWFAWRIPQKPKKPGDDTQFIVNGGGMTTKTNGKTSKSGKQPGKKNGVKQGPQAALTRLRDDALQLADRNAASSQHSDVSKAISRQLAADGYAQAGDIEKAETALQRLRNVTGNSGRYFQVRPLVSLGWHYLKSNDPASRAKAEKYLKDAQAIVDVGAEIGRARYDNAAELAAAWFASGKSDLAAQIIQKNSSPDAVGRESLIILTARHFAGNDVAAVLQNRPMHHVSSPQRVAVTLILAGNDRWRESWEWADKQSDPVDAADCRFAWAEALAAKHGVMKLSDSPLPGVEDVASKLPAVERGALYARVARHLFRHGNKEEAARMLKAAQGAVAGLPKPAAQKTPTVKAVFDTRVVPEAERRRSARIATALAELARAELALTESNAASAAWKRLSAAVDVCRSMGITPAEVATLQKTSEAEIGRLFELTKKAQKRKYFDYTTTLNRMKAAAEQRRATQSRIIERAIMWGNSELLPHIATGIESWSKPAAEQGKNESWFTTDVPTFLLVELMRTQQSGAADSLGKAMLASAAIQSKRAELWFQAHKILATSELNRFERVARLFDASEADSSWRHLAFLGLTARLVNEGKLDSAYQLCHAFNDQVRQIEAFDCLGAHAVRSLKPETVWKLIQQSRLRPWEATAVCHGFAVGIDIPAVVEPPKE